MREKKIKHFLLFGFALLLSVLLCNASSVGAQGDVSVDELLSAPEEIEIGNRMYVLDVFLWRDFMPFCPPNDRPLIASISVTATDSLEVLKSIDVDRIWIVNGGDVWESGFSSEERARHSSHNHLEKIARGGPKWSTGIMVDVVVMVIDGSDNIYLIKASDQPINRTE